MKLPLLPTLLFALALALAAFGYWGTSTAAGRRRFDEMAGMIPFAAYLLAALLGFIALILFALKFRNS